jgi:hypothetical protein
VSQSEKERKGGEEGREGGEGEKEIGVREQTA